ncbi:redox-sensing transcriptional repressor Rex [Staphylococcus gallinarum]|uniref:Redox-sensing transcriptional repressor Rex n=1 Tax=Staphylococcus gallinarum TaxID=1293 RepID=A0A380FJ67_STAGA|nr:redox-sensing transcriptional repressor Rex [Staphylococcus gallinarum]
MWIGTEIGQVSVSNYADITEVLEREQIDIVILTTPEDVAQQVTDKLVDVGVKGILKTLHQVVYLRHLMCKFIILI